MARSTKNFLVLAAMGFVVVAGVAGALAWSAAVQLRSCDGWHLSDDKMIRDFTAHKQEFAEVFQMLQTYPELEHVDEWAGDSPMDPEKLADQTAARYWSLLKQLGIEGVMREGNELAFWTSTFGLGISGSAKGYLYSEEPPTPLVGNTQRDAIGDSGEVYRQIQDGWYLFYEWDT